MAKKDTRKRTELRINEDRYDQIKHFAGKDNISINAWIEKACLHYIDYINADYDVPTALVQRVNQLVDGNQQLANLIQHLIDINISGFDSMSTLMHGSNYLNSSNGADDDSQNNNN